MVGISLYLSQYIFVYHHKVYTSRTHIFLSTRIYQVKSIKIDHPAKNITAHISHQGILTDGIFCHWLP